MKIKQSFVGAAIATAIGGTAVAEEPISPNDLVTAGMSVGTRIEQDGRNYHAYFFQEIVNPDGRFLGGKALVDKVVGVTCEWTIEGRLLQDDQYELDSASRQFQCVQSTDIPEKWVSKYPRDPDWFVREMAEAYIARYGVSKDVAYDAARIAENKIINETGIAQQSEDNPLIIKEEVDSLSHHGLPFWRIRHTWNLATREVCLQVVQEPELAMREDGMPYIDDLGCFPITDYRYLNRLMSPLDAQPA